MALGLRALIGGLCVAAGTAITALLAILERRGAVAAWLRERGVDEWAVREMLGD